MFANRRTTVTDMGAMGFKRILYGGTTVFAYLEKLTGGGTKEEAKTPSYKLCIHPFKQQQKPQTNNLSLENLKQLVKFYTTSKEQRDAENMFDYSIHAYDEVSGAAGKNTGYKLPYHIVQNTLSLLEDREPKVKNDDTQLPVRLQKVESSLTDIMKSLESIKYNMVESHKILTTLYDHQNKSSEV